ncbi:MAG: DUF4340 domain-containing protein [Nitrospinaceae bacterium]|nr:DUF4340 domain-containing protein [Nitrospinaceae bacterium]
MADASVYDSAGRRRLRAKKTTTVNFKKNLILLAAFLVAAGAYYLYDVKWAGEKKAEEERKAKFLKGVKPELLMRVSLQRKKEPFQVIRAEKVWRFVKPVDAQMDEDQQEIVLKAAAGLKPGRKLGKVADISEFGLDTPEITLILGVKGESDVSLQIGDITPTREFRYASLKSNKSHIFTIKISDIAKINKSVFELRDRSIVAVNTDNVQRIVVEPREQVSFSVARKDKENWEMLVPIKDAADNSESDSILTTLRWQKASRFVKEDPKAEDLVAYGLDKPVYTVRLFMDKEGKKTDGLHMGMTTEGTVKDARGRKKKAVLHYVRRVSGGPVMLVADDVLKNLPKAPFNLRKKNVIDYDVDHITRLKIENPIVTLDIKRLAKKKWDMKISRPNGESVSMPARHKHVDDVLWDIKWANAVEFVDAPKKADMAKYGLAPKADNRVSVWIKKKEDGPEVKRSFTLGPLVDDKKTFGRMDEQKRLFAFSKKNFYNILRGGFYLSDRRLTKFDEDEDISKITLNFSTGKEMVFRRNGAEWDTEKPAGKKANGSKLNSLVAMLKELEHEGEAKDEGGYDFGKFRARVSLEGKRGKKLGTVTFAGGGSAKEWFVRQGEAGSASGGKTLRVKKSQIGPNLPEMPSDVIIEKQKKEKS